MTRPIAVRPGATLVITQQTHNREFRFKPTPVVRDICMYLLVHSLCEHGMELYGALFMSNHYHLVVRDIHGRHPEFRQYFHSLLARALNHLQGERDHVFSSQEGSAVALLTTDCRFDKLVYTYLNPSADNLVKTVDEWPGASTYNTAMTRQVIRRPKELFGGETALPETVDLGDVMPTDLSSRQRKTLRSRIHEKVKRDEAQANIERRQQGRGVMGACALRAVHHKATPTTRRQLRGRRPVSVTKRKPVQLQQLRERRAHVYAYALAKKELVKENRKPMHLRRRVLFPLGTHKLWRGGFVDRKATPRCGPLPTYVEWLGLGSRTDDHQQPPDPG